MAKPAGPEGPPPGSFRGFRLLPGAALEAVAAQLRRQLAEALLAEPPYAMRWMQDYPEQVCAAPQGFDWEARLLPEHARPFCWRLGALPLHVPSTPTSPMLGVRKGGGCTTVRPPQDLLLRCMTDPSLDANTELAAAACPLTDDERTDVLALRGLLACGVLEHCLTLRHLVDYGTIK